MDARSLQQFVAVVEHGTIGRAADALHMTQSALTKSRGKAGRVVMGAGPSLVAGLVPRAILGAAGGAPDLQVEVVEGVVSNLLPRLQAGEIDFFIGTAAPQSLDRHLKAERLFDDRISVVGGRSHPLHRKRGLTLADLLPMRWALPDPGHSLTLGCARIFQEAGLPAPVPAVVTSSLTCLEALLVAGTHVSVAPDPGRPWARDAFVPFRVEGGSWERAIWLYRRAGQAHSPAAAAMVDALRTACGQPP